MGERPISRRRRRSPMSFLHLAGPFGLGGCRDSLPPLLQTQVKYQRSQLSYLRYKAGRCYFFHLTCRVLSFKFFIRGKLGPLLTSPPSPYTRIFCFR
ncbi:hypothetical protein BU23DRAFT_336626 [Bimuria novae-zelandiae CBS 107.79]|uniref:Uncharacterized protein n=1 Tax=Bimuria novae-zelandiae CBS 107.79 TaxID=1447943 RepID=A0A6A5UMF7_9PLEO|nr:hypothetical protein BU23DRAFT_336626 [Bimuria novae-zelandiae CBS 107.79]